jgi:mono/diheme cytochrome c family protein
MAMVAVVATTALVACGGDAGETDDMTDDTTMTPAPAPAPVPTASGTPPEGATPEMVTQGQQIFAGKGNCFTCHGPEAQGTPLAPNLTDATWLNLTDPAWQNLQQAIRNGVPTPVEHPSPMPPMGGAQLSDQEIQAVAAYVYSISHGG